MDKISVNLLTDYYLTVVSNHCIEVPCVFQYHCPVISATGTELVAWPGTWLQHPGEDDEQQH